PNSRYRCPSKRQNRGDQCRLTATVAAAKQFARPTGSSVVFIQTTRHSPGPQGELQTAATEKTLEQPTTPQTDSDWVSHIKIGGLENRRLWIGERPESLFRAVIVFVANGLQPDCFSLLSGCHSQIGRTTVRGCAVPMLDSRS